MEMQMPKKKKADAIAKAKKLLEDGSGMPNPESRRLIEEALARSLAALDELKAREAQAKAAGKEARQRAKELESALRDVKALARAKAKAEKAEKIARKIDGKAKGLAGIAAEGASR
jgi:hypothetical protein